MRRVGLNGGLLTLLAVFSFGFLAMPVVGVVIDVKDAGSGVVLDGAKVTVAAGGKTLSGVSGADGACRFDVALKAGAKIDAEKEGWCPMRWELSGKDAALQIFDFALPKAALIGGLVVDETGSPVTGARIQVNFPQRLSGAHIPLDDLAAVSDSAGKWEANFVPADASLIHIDLTETNHQWQPSEPDIATLRGRNARFTMTTLRALRGMVVDPEGNPVAGASVYFGDSWGIQGLSNPEQATTGADGRFSSQSAELGKRNIAAWDGKFGGVIQTVVVKKDMPPIELRLTTPHPRKFRVTDLEGHALTNATARVSRWGEFQYPPQSLKADGEGRMVFSNAPAGQMEIDFEAPDRFSLVMRPVAETENEQLIQLGPPLWVHGKVTDKKTGEPIGTFKITAGWPRQRMVNGQMTNQGAGWASYENKTFHNGAYEWKFTQSVLVGTEKPTDFYFRVEADGKGPEISRLVKATEEDGEIDFALAAPVYHTNIARFPDGSPAEGATIYFAGDGRLRMENGVVKKNGRDLRSMTADADGSFRWIRDEDESSFLIWHDEGFADVPVGDMERSNVITLTRWGKVSGTLWRGDHVAAHEPVALCFNQKPQKPGARRDPLIELLFSYPTQTDGEGRFIFDKVTPGVVSVARVEKIPPSAQRGISFGDAWGGCRLEVIDVPQGGKVEVKAGGNGRAIIGRLSSTNDLADCDANLTALLPPPPYPVGLEGAAKDAWAKKWFWSEAGAKYRIWYGDAPEADQPHFWTHSWPVKVEGDGTFRIDDVPPGDYALTVYFNNADGSYRHNVNNEVEKLVKKFNVPPGENLASSPPLDIGLIGEEPSQPTISVAEPTTHEPVMAGMATAQSAAHPGDIIDVVVKARIADGHHIYAAFKQNESFTPTSLNLNLPDGLEAVSDWEFPHARQIGNEWGYTNTAVFRRPVKVRADAKGGVFTIKGIMHCEACNDDICWPPKDIPLMATISIETVAKGTP